MKLFSLFLLIACVVHCSIAQKKTTFVLGIEGNTQGAGLELSTSFAKHPKWSYRLSYDYFRYLKESSIELTEGSTLILNPAVRQQALSTKVDWHPFRRGFFRLTGGLSYHVIQDYRVLASSTTGIKQGDITIAPEDFGVIDAQLKWNSLRPYLGFGWGSAFPKHRISFGFDMGVYYMGSPSLKVSYEGFLETTNLDEQLKKIESRAKGYSYYPNLNFQLRYRL